MKFTTALPVLASIGGVLADGMTAPQDLDVKDDASIRDVAATIAHGALGYYKGNTTNNPIDVGDLSDPYYWWVAGALWGGLLDYFHYTKDPSYNDVVIEALLNPTNLGPNFDYVPQEHAFEEGNDDLYFWGSAALSAAERNFPQPDTSIPGWLEIAGNVFDSLQSRWNTSHCGGGLTWQMYPDNPNGMNYKNSIANGGLFQIAARLARATGNQTHLDWAEKTWDWVWDKNLIDHEAYHVYDGTDSANDCADVSKSAFTYTQGVFLYGAAVLANHTGEDRWVDRASKLLDGADWFFGQSDNSTDILYEGACEPDDSCNADMETHKAYLSRNMWATAIMLPALREKIETKLTTSAEAAAKTCTGGDDGLQCGMKWYVGGFDGEAGLGPQMTALEVVHGLLSKDAEPPLKGDDIKTVRDKKWKPVDPNRKGD